MSTPMTLSHFFLLLLFLVEITSTFNPSAASHDSSVSSKPRGIVLNLIHRNSILSPYYNPNATQWDLTRKAIAASLARARSYSQIIAAWKDDGAVHANGGVPVLSSQSGDSLLAKIFVGQPAVEQLLLIDTGSSVTWIHCQPCENCPGQSSALFDPQRSSTYSPIPCKGDDGSKPCEAVGGVCDDSQTRCLFKNLYADGAYIEGDFAKETLVFGESSLAVNAFGCARKHKVVGEATEFQESGLLGLGLDSSSVLGQFGRKFSQCLGYLSDSTYQYHKLFLGEAAKLDGPSTPIVSLLYGHYYVGLEGISVNRKKLDIDPDVFKLDTSTGEGGTVLDCGTPLTFLKSDAYDPLATTVLGFLKRSHRRIPFMIGQFVALCFKGTVDEVITSPSVTLHFNGGAQMELYGHSLFRQVRGDVFCMSIVVAEDLIEDHPVNIIGVLAQQFYNIGFDVNAMKVHLHRVDCKDI